MMNKRICLLLSVIVFVFFLNTSLHARDLWLSELICSEVMEEIQSILDRELSKIPKKPYFIQKSSSRISQITTMMERVGDCVIRSVHAQEQAVIFFYDTNLSTHAWTKDIPSTIQKIKIPALLKEKEYSAAYSEQDLRIGIICRDKKLLGEITEWLNKIDTDKIIDSANKKYRSF